MGSPLANLPRAIVENVVGLIVDDGLVVVGALGALAITGLLATYATGVPHIVIGVLLFILVIGSLVASLLRAARGAQRHAVEDATVAGRAGIAEPH